MLLLLLLNMKSSWIKTSDQLPELFTISSNWQMSKTLLLTNKAEAIGLGVYQILNNEKYWVFNEYLKELEYVTHWCYVELPVSQLLEDMRDTQNYKLNT